MCRELDRQRALLLLEKLRSAQWEQLPSEVRLLEATHRNLVVHGNVEQMSRVFATATLGDVIQTTRHCMRKMEQSASSAVQRVVKMVPPA